MNRTRKGGLWKLFRIRDNSKTFLNVTLGMILDSVDEMLAGMGMVHFNMKFQFFSGGGGNMPPDPNYTWVPNFMLVSQYHMIRNFKIVSVAR